MKLTIQLYNQGMTNIHQAEQFSNTDYSWKILVKEGYDLIWYTTTNTVKLLEVMKEDECKMQYRTLSTFLKCVYCSF